MLGLPTFALVLALSAVVALPSMLAIVRKHPHWLAITIVDVLFGWTVVGWIAAVVWVLRPVKARKARVKRQAKKRPARAKKPAANDNLTEPAAGDSIARTPAPLDGDVYEEWLERGAALGVDDAIGIGPTRPAAEAVPSPSPRKVAA